MYVGPIARVVLTSRHLSFSNTNCVYETINNTAGAVTQIRHF